MVGICGAVGGTLETSLIDSLSWKQTETVTQYRDHNVEIAVSTHNDQEQPIETDDGSRLFLWGQVYGHQDGGYTPKSKSFQALTDLEYCAALYNEYGEQFVDGLNGEFTLVWHNPTEDTVSIATDRLSTHPLYHLETDSGFHFGPYIQQLAQHSDFSAEFSIDYTYEYLSFRRAFGCKTPVKNVEMFHPGAVSSYNTVTEQMNTDVYWHPVYDPKDKSYSYFEERFSDILHSIVNEALDGDRKTGLMLSGGTDSRAIMAAADSSITGIHATDWEESKETKVANKIARRSNNPIKVIERDLDYHRDAVRENPQWSNFNSWFNQAHAAGLAEEIRSEVDYVLLGLYSDAIFSLSYYPRKEVKIAGLDNLRLPIAENIDTLESYIDYHLKGKFDKKFETQPEYLKQPPNLQDILRRNIRMDNHIIHHGVEYPSLTELLTSMYYPATNLMSFFFYETMIQTVSCRMPFFDDRLIDLHLQMPLKYHMRRDIVRDSIMRHDPTLTEIPHSNIDLPLKYPVPLQLAGRLITKFKREKIGMNNPPVPYLRNEGWGVDHDEMIRQTDIIKKAFEDKEDLFESIDFIDTNNVWEVYKMHLNGENRRSPLYTLLTFSQMPLVSDIFKQTSTISAESE